MKKETAEIKHLSEKIFKSGNYLASSEKGFQFRSKLCEVYKKAKETGNKIVQSVCRASISKSFATKKQSFVIARFIIEEKLNFEVI